MVPGNPYRSRVNGPLVDGKTGARDSGPIDGQRGSRDHRRNGRRPHRRSGSRGYGARTKTLIHTQQHTQKTRTRANTNAPRGFATIVRTRYSRSSANNTNREDDAIRFSIIYTDIKNGFIKRNGTAAVVGAFVLYGFVFERGSLYRYDSSMPTIPVLNDERVTSKTRFSLFSLISLYSDRTRSSIVTEEITRFDDAMVYHHHHH